MSNPQQLQQASRWRDVSAPPAGLRSAADLLLCLVVVQVSWSGPGFGAALLCAHAASDLFRIAGPWTQTAGEQGPLLSQEGPAGSS